MINTIGYSGIQGVQVHGTHNAATQGLTEETQRPVSGAKLPASASNEADGKALDVVSSQQRLIAAAAQADEIDSKAVEQAKADLQSGLLDTPQAALRAAQAILDRGL